jgi:competence protein ComEA
MFRRTSTRGDAVLAARQRLAALAAQYDQEPEDDQHDDVGVAPGAKAGTSVPAEHEPHDRSTGGRHARLPDASGPRWLSPHHLALSAIVVAVAVAVAAWWVLRTAPDPEPVQLSTEHVEQPAPSTGSPTITDSAPTATVVDAAPTGAPNAQGSATGVVVDVAGKVRRPGIVELPAGSRVVDALDAAGGARPGADTSTLNLARPLVDGEQVVVGLDVPALAPSAAPPTSSMAVSPINLNTATAEQLDTLPGIGPVTAAAILQWRDEHGSFTAVDELLEVSGIGPATLADIEALVHV